LSSPLRKSLALAFGGATLGSVLLVGAMSAVSRLSSSLRAVPESLVPGWIQDAVPAVEASLPPDAAVLYVTDDPNTWRCGLWQRALLPRAVFCLRPGEKSRRELARIRREFPLRFAVGSAEPPSDLVIVRRRAVSPRIWVGEIGP